MLGEIGVLRRLPDHRRPQPQEPLVGRHGGEQLGVEDYADVGVHVVIHPLGVDDAVALAEDDIAFHVDFQGRLAGLIGLAGLAGLGHADRPEHQPVGGKVDRAHVRHAVDDHVHTRLDNRHRPVGGPVNLPLRLHRHLAAGEHPDPPRRRRRYPGTARTGVRARRRGGHRRLAVDRRRQLIARW